MEQVNGNSPSRSMVRIKPETVIPKLIAIGIVSLLIAWWASGRDNDQVAKFASMTPAEYVAYKRPLYESHMPYLTWAIAFFVSGLIYILIVEAIAFVLRTFWPTKNPFSINDKSSA